MPRTCTICTHLQRSEVEAALLAGESYRYIAARFGTSTGAIQRHKQSCIAQSLSKASEVREVAQGDSLLQRLKDINGETLAILKEARKTGDDDIALKAVARVEKQLELEAKLLGELSDAPTINFNVTINQLEAVIVQALTPFPEARLAVAQALKESNL